MNDLTRPRGVRPRISEAERARRIYAGWGGIGRRSQGTQRAFPDLTPERAMTTTDRLEYEASFAPSSLRRAMGGRTLDAILRDGLSPTP